MPSAHPLYLYSGPDAFRRSEAVKARIEALLPEEERAFNLTRLSGRGLDPERLGTALGTMPLFADRRVVHLDDAEQLTSAALIALVAALDAAQGSDSLAVLVVYGGDTKPPKDLIQRARQHEEFSAFKRRRDAIDWVRSYTVRRHQMTLPADVADRLTEYVGQADAGRLAVEVDKLVGLANGRALTVADVEFATADAAEATPYALYDHVGMRRVAEARAELARVLRNPDYPGVRVVIGLSIHLTNIALARARLDTGERPSAVAQALGGWFGDKYVRQAAEWTREELDAALAALGEADRALKRGIDDGPALTCFLLRALVPGSLAEQPLTALFPLTV